MSNIVCISGSNEIILEGMKACDSAYKKVNYAFLSLFVFVLTMMLLFAISAINGYPKALDFVSIAVILSFPLIALYKIRERIEVKITKRFLDSVCEKN